MSGLADVQWPVRTERLSIRPARAEDAEATWEYRQIPSIAYWMTTAPTTYKEYADLFVVEDRISKSLIIERDGAIVGDLMLAIEDAWGQAEVKDQAKGVQAEVGWCLRPEEEGQGLATEAARELLRICFEDLGLRRVIALCFAANEPSRRVMERLGMRLEEHAIQDSLHRNGEWLDGYRYALLADEWRARPARPAKEWAGGC
jgi:RimJ/RimL family protein N-acetyltransferase